jgi:hypothetical protein
MQRTPQIVFVVSLISLCWLGMMAIHELGHVTGAIITGGVVNRVVLNPVTISRTDVLPNPSPGIVVWAGPVMGSLLPIAILMIVRVQSIWRSTAKFFAGFCLIANGAYISIGSFDRIGDTGEMLRTGTPVWLMLLFGTVMIPAGLFNWHRTGSVKAFFSNPSCVTDRMACSLVAILGFVLLSEFLLSPL